MKMKIHASLKTRESIFMKKQIRLTLAFVLLGFTATTQVLRNFTPRYNNPSVRGNIVFVANNIISASAGGTGEAPPGGTSTNNGSACINLDIDGTPPDTIVQVGSNWKYLANNTRPANWQTTGFNDAAWPAGNGQFGYGDGDETTCVPSGGGGTLCNPTGNKWITTYFRKAINIPNPALYGSFSLGVHRDDGIVVYVNGTEVYRDNMPAGAVAHGTLATAAAGDDGATLQTTTLVPATFVPGNNVIAVEVHQNNATSSDLSFDLQLIGIPSTTTTFFPLHSNWKYLANNTRPANWETTAFNDAAWPAGNGQFGYGDGDETTCVPSGGGGTVCTPTGNKWITTYFRKTVNIPNPSLFYTFPLGVHRDDGIVVYINGIEVYRDNMPAGPVAHGTLATAAASDDGATLHVVNIPPSAFIAGNNVIAVEVHQNDITSSDLSFDMQLLGSTDSTFNSSSADLNLPACSNILFAGLYWGATQGTDGGNISWRTGETMIKLKVPGATNYVNVTSTQTDYHDSTLVSGLPHTGYRCFADITGLLNATSPNGTYTLANLVAPIGINNGAGGWTIVIVYGNPALQPRNLTVFDGSAIMNGGDPALYIPVSGFLTPPTGPVSCELGAVVFDGDRGQTDEFSFKENSNPLIGTYTSLTPNTTSNNNDMWNSTITYKGASVLTRSPAHLNTLGYDADIVDVPNPGNSVLSNSQTSASIRFSSPSENYFLHCVTTSISNYNPTFAFQKTATDLSGGAFVPGDSLRYAINYINQGNDSSVNTIITDNIPSGTSFVPGSIRIGGVTKTDAAGDDEAEFDLANNRVIFRIGVGATALTGGRVGPGVSSVVDFKVIAASSCQIVSCVGSLRNSARINYGGKLSGNILFDSSGVNTAGCIVQGPVIHPLAGACFVPRDTVLVNHCTSLTVTIPYERYAGYTFYSAMPFIPANLFNQYAPVSASGVYWAYYTNGAGCSDTARISVIITSCPDIDDDNDGIPDYVEFDNLLALQDHNSNGIPNWKDPAYPGYVDNNLDGVNDNFDWGADANANGIPNFYDTGFGVFVDSNGDGVNDNADKDLDGIPNQYDLDSDNDGILDVVESYGVDTNGNGVIDNYSDTDNDGFSQNVDANNTGVQGSGNGLGAQDFDGDGIPNYLDLDSDNDGIPDVIEAAGPDANNNGMLDTFADLNSDGISDGYVNGTALLLTGVDANADGRADSWPNKNLDQDLRPNAYDLDSDGDGIVDVLEAGLTDANLNGIVDGAIGTNGWSSSVSSLIALNLPNTDGNGNPNYLDIDSDDDGIPDNIEGMSTAGYIMPVTTDTDGDGLANSYDNSVSFGGSGIFIYDHDGDGTPDYRDADTDGDGQPDVVEGNDFNLNGIADDNVTLTGLDTDGDGLDNRFDSLNSVINIKGTSYRMGTGGTFTGDATPGSRTTVQRRFAFQTDRDWRYVGTVLPVQFLQLTGTLQADLVTLDWKLVATKAVDHLEVERSTDNLNYSTAGTVWEAVRLNEPQDFRFADNVSGLQKEVIYYRIKVIGKAGEIQYSNVLVIRLRLTKPTLTIIPNPARESVLVSFTVSRNTEATIRLIDNTGKTVRTEKQKVQRGNNTILLNQLDKYATGMYLLQVHVDEQLITERLILTK